MNEFRYMKVTVRSEVRVGWMSVCGRAGSGNFGSGKGTI